MSAKWLNRLDSCAFWALMALVTAYLVGIIFAFAFGSFVR